MSRPRAPAAVASAALVLLAAGPGAGRAEPAAGAASCLSCHGGGAATDGAFPDLGSLPAQAIEEALAAYRSGARDGTVMPRIARGFSADEARVLARALGRGSAPGGAGR